VTIVAENLLVRDVTGQFSRMRILWTSGVLALVMGAGAACAGAAPAPASLPAAVATPAPDPAPPPVASGPPASEIPAENAVRRSAVHALVTEGLGAFLQRVDVDDQPVFLGGKFHGFRIAGLRDGKAWSGFWSGVDLKPGDVVTSVNGLPIEHPEQAQTAFEALEVARELRVAYERGSQTRELVYPIVNDH
jgi:hypothetical protein